MIIQGFKNKLNALTAIRDGVAEIVMQNNPEKVASAERLFA